MHVILSKIANYILLTYTFIMVVHPVAAQTRLVGNVSDNTGQAVPFANVLLLSSTDSTLVKGDLANEDAEFVVVAPAAGNYLLFVSILGYQDYYSSPFQVGSGAERDMGEIILIQQDISLDEVVVESQRALFEQREDRLVVNVSNRITFAGGQAIDVLRRSPGVVVNDQSGSVTIAGKSGVQLLVNGKISNIPPEALLQYLSGLSADEIESVELITNPPSSLDAEGDAGFVNIIFKKNPDDGLNGSLSVSGGYGEGDVGSLGFNIHYRRNRLSVHGTYSFIRTNQDVQLTNFRQVRGVDGLLETPAVSLREPMRHTHNVRLGMDYRVSSQTTLGISAAGYDNRFNMDATTNLSVIQAGTSINAINIITDELNHWQHLMGNVYMQHTSENGHKFSVQGDYLYYRNENPSGYMTLFSDPRQNTSAIESVDVGKTTPFNILVGKIDYLRPINTGWQLSVGLKAAISEFTNSVSYADLIPGQGIIDITNNEESELSEDVLAAYVENTYKVNDAVNVKAGIRYEYTDSKLATPEATLVDRQIGEFFPSVLVSAKVSQLQKLNLSYSRRISRPSFNDMAPFLLYIDPFTYFTGNVALQPAISNTIKVDYSYKTFYSSFQLSREDSTLARFQNQVLEDENLQLILPINQKGRTLLSALLALPIQLTGWWNTENNAFISWQQVEGFQNRSRVTEEQASLRLGSTHTFTLPSAWQIEMSGFYQSATLFGLVEFQPTWRMDLGLQKVLSDNKGKLTLSVVDVFDSDERTGITGSRSEPVFVERTVDFSLRTVRLTYSRTFGAGKKAAIRKTASDVEGRRVQ